MNTTAPRRQDLRDFQSFTLNVDFPLPEDGTLIIKTWGGKKFGWRCPAFEKKGEETLLSNKNVTEMFHFKT